MSSSAKDATKVATISTTISKAIGAALLLSTSIFTVFKSMYRDTYKDEEKWKSTLVRSFMKSSKINVKGMSSYLHITEQALRNKLVRDSFTLDEIFAIANICGYEMSFKKKNSVEELKAISAEELFPNDKKEIVSIINSANDDRLNKYKQIKAQLSELQAEADEMNRLYHFDDKD